MKNFLDFFRDMNTLDLTIAFILGTLVYQLLLGPLAVYVTNPVIYMIFGAIDNVEQKSIMLGTF